MSIAGYLVRRGPVWRLRPALRNDTGEDELWIKVEGPVAGTPEGDVRGWPGRSRWKSGGLRMRLLWAGRAMSFIRRSRNTIRC
jgi:hypothetical protein